MDIVFSIWAGFSDRRKGLILVMGDCFDLFCGLVVMVLFLSRLIDISLVLWLCWGCYDLLGALVVMKCSLYVCACGG